MHAELNDVKHLSPVEFDAELGKAIKAAMVKRRPSPPVAKPKKKTTTKK